MIPAIPVSLKFNQVQPAYASSSSGGELFPAWIQESITVQTLEISTHPLIKGIYAQVSEAVLPIQAADPSLAHEFAAWEAASDEALFNFEKNLE